MKSTLVDGLPYHPTMKHPSTGQRLRALAIVNGSPLWPVFGSDGDDDADGDKKSEEKPDESKDKDGKDDKDSAKSDKSGKSDSAFEELQEKFNRMKIQLSESDKKRTAAEKRIEEIDSKDLSELQKAQKDLTAKEKREAELEASFNKLALDNAFLKASQRLKITWHDPDVAQAAAKLGSLEVGSDGTVEGIEEALKKLAKSKAFLVDSGKAKDEDGEEGADKDKKEIKKGPSGSGVGSGQNGGKGKKEEPDAEELRRRFPALRK